MHEVKIQESSFPNFSLGICPQQDVKNGKTFTVALSAYLINQTDFMQQKHSDLKRLLVCSRSFQGVSDGESADFFFFFTPFQIGSREACYISDHIYISHFNHCSSQSYERRGQQHRNLKFYDQRQSVTRQPGKVFIQDSSEEEVTSEVRGQICHMIM